MKSALATDAFQFGKFDKQLLPLNLDARDMTPYEGPRPLALTSRDGPKLISLRVHRSLLPALGALTRHAPLRPAAGRMTDNTGT